MSQAITPNHHESLTAQGVSGQNEYLQSTSGALNVNVTGGSGTTQYAELSTTAPGTGNLSLGRFKSSAPTLTDGQMYGLQLDSAANLKVTLATLFAGEDTVNNRLMVSSEVVNLNTQTFNNVAFLANATQNSASINCSNFRRFFMVGTGSVAGMKILLQVSFDGGVTWIWHPNGQTAVNQFPGQQGDLTGAPLCRMSITNDVSAQNITAFVGLGR